MKSLSMFRVLAEVKIVAFIFRFGVDLGTH